MIGKVLEEVFIFSYDIHEIEAEVAVDPWVLFLNKYFYYWSRQWCNARTIIYIYLQLFPYSIDLSWPKFYNKNLIFVCQPDTYKFVCYFFYNSLFSLLDEQSQNLDRQVRRSLEVPNWRGETNQMGRDCTAHE